MVGGSDLRLSSHFQHPQGLFSPLWTWTVALEAPCASLPSASGGSLLVPTHPLLPRDSLPLDPLPARTRTASLVVRCHSVAIIPSQHLGWGPAERGAALPMFSRASGWPHVEPLRGAQVGDPMAQASTSWLVPNRFHDAPSWFSTQRSDSCSAPPCSPPS